MAQTGIPTSVLTRSTKAAAAGGTSVPEASEEQRLGRRQIVEVDRHLVHGAPAEAVADAELDLVEASHDIELGERQ